MHESVFRRRTTVLHRVECSALSHRNTNQTSRHLMRTANDTSINIHRITRSCQWPLNKYYAFQVIRFRR